jgi:hypothetical protein
MHYYGYKKDHPDPRDLLRVARPETLAATLPPIVDLRAKVNLPVLDQGQSSACTSHALANAHLFAQFMNPGGTNELPSRLAIYYGERKLEGTTNQDCGAEIRDGIKFLAANGAVPERYWPFDLANILVEPPSTVEALEPQHKITKYERVGDLNGNIASVDPIRQALFEGDPVVIGITVFQSFESAEVAQTGIVPLPQVNEGTIGGHAVLVVGYNDEKQTLLVLNSWSAEWGQQGYFELPYAYIAYASDAWTINVVLKAPPVPQPAEQAPQPVVSTTNKESTMSSIWTDIENIFTTNKQQVVSQIEALVNTNAPTLLPKLTPVIAEILTKAGVTLPADVLQTIISTIVTTTITELEADVNAKI